MNPWAAHFASGNVLFTGAALLTVAAVAAWQPARRPSRKARRLCLLIAAPLIAASATPLPWLMYAAWSTPVVALFLLDRQSERAGLRKSRRAAVAVVVSLSLFVVIRESRTLLPVTRQQHQFHTVYVIGDSVSAGMADPPERVWPAVMGREHRVDVVNLAREGATTRSALRQAEQVDHTHCVVIVEIGGNDLLEGVPGRRFEQDLKELLQELSAPGRQIVLMELPLPPLCNEYGRVQRRLARDFEATLISKRVFAGVLAASDATVDGVHLSPHGHQLMSERIWKQVDPLIAD
jgi:acyl-CoA thioesterase-1